jgi:hypothetical protein
MISILSSISRVLLCLIVIYVPFVVAHLGKAHPLGILVMPSWPIFTIVESTWGGQADDAELMMIHSVALIAVIVFVERIGARRRRLAVFFMALSMLALYSIAMSLSILHHMDY